MDDLPLRLHGHTEEPGPQGNSFHELPRAHAEPGITGLHIRHGFRLHDPEWAMHIGECAASAQTGPGLEMAGSHGRLGALRDIIALCR